jgi:hypothetical protein
MLQPVAHALLQACEEVEKVLEGFDAKFLWERPGGVASIAFHLHHLVGVIDRLFTYAEGNQLSDDQRREMMAEGSPSHPAATLEAMIRALQLAVDRAIKRLEAVDASTLTDAREVGRARAPSTVIGLFFHAAEHSQRHVGQLLVTARIQMDGATGGAG